MCTVIDHVNRHVFLFSCPQNPSINNLNFHCIKQIDNIFPCVHMYCNRSQKTSQRVKNNGHATRLHVMSYFSVLYTLWRHMWSIQYTHMEKCNLFVLYNEISNGLLNDFGGMQKEKHSADVIWRGFDVICVCVSFSRSR